MDEFWVRALVAVLAASCGAASVVIVFVRRYWRRAKPRSAARSRPEADAVSRARLPGTAGPGSDASCAERVSPTDRCEQAVLRAERAVASTASITLRERLSPVVRRMEAELPNVRALDELARGLDPEAAWPGGPAPSRPAPSCPAPSRPAPSCPASSHPDTVAERTREQLDNAASRFAAIADEVLETVAELARDPGPDRLPDRVAALRERFPLTCSMSEVLGRSVAA